MNSTLLQAARRSPAVRTAAWRCLARFRDDARGATAIEYALVAAVISIVILGATLSLGARLNAKFLGPVVGGFG